MNSFDRENYERIREYLPDRIVDCHTHVWKAEFKNDETSERGVSWPDLVCNNNPIENLERIYSEIFPDIQVTPVIFPCVSAGTDIERANDYMLECSRLKNYPAMALISPEMSRSKIEEFFDRGFAGLKPYFNFAPKHIKENDIEIFDFMTREHLEAADKRGGAVMMHIPRKGRIGDPVNIRQLLEIEEKYQNIKLIVAHVGRAYAKEDFGDGFKQLRETKNMVFDISANTLPEAMEAAIETFGPDRVLFGSDMPISIMRMRRIIENGIYINLVPPGLYGDISGDPHMRETDEQVTWFIYENIKAMMTVGLSKNDVNKVFYDNACRLFGIGEQNREKQQISVQK